MSQNEDPYLKALCDLNSDCVEEKKWLLRHFELFKTTLIWPEDKPPINRSLLVKGTLKQKFNEVYWDIMNRYTCTLVNKTKSLHFD